MMKKFHGRDKGRDSQHSCTHSTLVSMHFAIWATDRVILPGAYEHSIPHLAPKLTAELLENEENIFSEQFSTLLVPLPIKRNRQRVRRKNQ